MNLNKLNYNNLIQEAAGFSVAQNDSYIESYPEFLQYFTTLERIEKHHLIISAHFVYGWMPTIVHLNLEETDQILLLLNHVKSGTRLKEYEINMLKSFINNSLVGLSKLLHFINPAEYAIWDSRIFRYLTHKKSQYGIDKAENYLGYLTKMKELSNHESYPRLHTMIEKHFNYSLTPMRAIEILMFETARKNNN